MTDGITEPCNAERLMYEGLGRSHKVISQLNDDLTMEEVVDSIIQDVITIWWMKKNEIVTSRWWQL